MQYNTTNIVVEEDPRDPFEVAWEEIPDFTQFDEMACSDNPDRMFIGGKKSRTGKEARAALGVCGGCTVRLSCLKDAMESDLNDDADGVRGGYLASERRELAKLEHQVMMRAILRTNPA